MSLPTPTTREEIYLNAIANGESSNLPTPETRTEAYLAYIAENGGGGTGGGDVTGVKGSAETTYRKGNVSISPDDLGLGTAALKDSTNAVTANSTDLVESGAVKNAIDAAIASTYKPAGDKTCSQLVSALLVAGNLGNVYNVTDSGTTTSDFVGGADKPIHAGDNVAIVDVGSAGSPSYKFDLLAGFIDLSNYPQKSQTAGLMKNDGTIDTTQYVSDVSGKADKVTGGTENNFAALDASGGIKDSGAKASDFDKTWTGTSTAWAQLSAAEKAKYDFADFTDDASNTVVDNTPTSGSTNLITSGGVYNHRVVAGQKANTTLGTKSTAEGNNNTVSANYAHAEGSSNTIMSGYSHYGTYSHVEGSGNTVYGMNSHAEGEYNTVYGDESHAEGYYTEVSGDYAHAEGYYTKASSDYQHVCGKFNVEDISGTYLFIIGNGTASNARNNAFAVDRLGNVSINTTTNPATSDTSGTGCLTVGGVISVNGSDYAELFPALEEIPMCRFVTLDSEFVKLAHNCDDYILGISSENPSIVGDKDVDGIEVGLLGKLWVEHDGTAVVNGYVKSGDNGIATRAKSGYRVMAVNGNKCRVLVK